MDIKNSKESCQEKQFQEFIKYKLETCELEDITIYSMNNEINEQQIWFQFKNNYDNILNMLCIYFEDYIKKSDKYIRISSFGFKEKIVCKIVSKELYKITPLNGIDKYLINIGSSMVPSVDNCFLYTVDKTSEFLEENNKCPICFLDINIKKFEKIFLKCGHFICRDCLFQSLENNLTSCPLCRQDLFTN